MNSKEIIGYLKIAKEFSPKRKFKQAVDFVVNLTGIDLKNTEQQIDFYVALNHGRGKKQRICALIGPELKDQAMKTCDTTITVDDFDKYAQNKNLIKKLADSHEYFVAQVNVMPKVATTFGRILGPRGKMPNPKAGCVVPPNANLAILSEKMQKTIRVTAKTTPVIHLAIGMEDMPEEQLADNILTVYNQILQHVPNEKQSIRSMILKLTMGPSINMGVPEIELRKRLLARHTEKPAVKEAKPKKAEAAKAE